MQTLRDGRNRPIHEKMHNLQLQLRTDSQGFILTSDPNRIEVRGAHNCFMVRYDFNCWILEYDDRNRRIVFPDIAGPGWEVVISDLVRLCRFEPTG
jgi:hypothetical protein